MTPANDNKASKNFKLFRQGMTLGLPIALGYFAVSFTLGIAARNAGISAAQASLMSLLCTASAGQYAGITVIAAMGTYWEMVLMEFVANIRYLLMSTALSQKLSPSTGLVHRLFMGWMVTDEIFGVEIAQEGKVQPFHNYGVFFVSIIGWTLGTFLGVVIGNILPDRAVSALSVGLFGMFIAIIIPPARKSRIVCALVAISMISSFFFNKLALFSGISTGIKTIVLTIIIAGLAAVFFPIKEEEEKEEDHAA